MTDNAYQAELDEIVGNLFRTMLGTEVLPTTECPPPGEDVITALLAFAGSWKGELIFECHRPQAHCFAKRFLQSDDLDASSEDIPSTVAELANIIAGNLKGVMPAGVNIGTPSVIVGREYTVRVCCGKTVHHRAFTTDTGGFRLRLVEDAQ